MHLLLFDIDGTLVRTHGAGNRAFAAAVLKVFGVHDDLKGINFWGGTDLDILDQVLKRQSLTTSPQQTSEFFQVLSDCLQTDSPPNRSWLLPGVVSLFEDLRSREQVGLGLVTGNAEKAAQVKLASLGPFFFDFGGYGDDHPDRREIAQLAVQRARSRFGRENFDSLALFGDTPNDIQAAHFIGAKAIGLGTGKFSKTQLLEAGADYFFDDLSRYPEVLSQIL